MKENEKQSQRSQGIKRVTLVSSIVLPVVFFGLSIFRDIHYGGSDTARDAFLILGVISIVLPVIVYKIGYWIADGFNRDDKKREGESS